ncbi:MAG TPA: hypothetical protein VMV79_01350 [Alphaproteobacteria bacterium]|nr:hypothetical protein [Alphaproteobacteria bacterium]
MNRTFLTALCFGVFSVALAVPASAASACYTPAELHARQVLRLHSELMVIAIACRTGSDGENLINAYTGFTQDNLDTIRDAEQTMIRYYSRHDGGSGIPQLDTLRTRLGNEASQQMALMSSPVFCAQYRDMVTDYYYDTPSQIEGSVNHMVIQAAARHSCIIADSGETVVAKATH